MPPSADGKRSKTEKDLNVAHAVHLIEAGGRRVAGPDPRDIENGWEIPSEFYCDQPYVTILPDGTWLCVMTTGTGFEGAAGQHVVSMRSSDQGRTWSPPVAIESAEEPESSWVVPLQVPSGRVYAFYTFNHQNMREVLADRFGVDAETGMWVYESDRIPRVDTLGVMAFRYSDDGGQSWSKDRYTVPMRKFDVDLENPYGGDVMFFWSVHNPIVHDGKAYIAVSKVGNFGFGFQARSECAFLVSENILSEPDPAKLRWQTLPDGTVGLRSPGGPVAEEPYLVSLDDGSLYCTYRTTDGWPCHAYSRDGGHTWTEPEYMTYTPGGRRIKHGRAANFPWKTSDGRYLYWFHNTGHGHQNWHGLRASSRNPVWLCGGVEKDGHIHWSQPEIALYAKSMRGGMSYPDFIEQDGRYFLTETQKIIARVHEVDPALLEGMWGQFERTEPARAGIEQEFDAGDLACGSTVQMKRLPILLDGLSFSLDLWLSLDDAETPGVIFSSRDLTGGISLEVDAAGRAVFSLDDEHSRSCWDFPAARLLGGPHHLSIIVDGGPKILSFVIDGELYDGEDRIHGWAHFSPFAVDVTGGPRFRWRYDDKKMIGEDIPLSVDLRIFPEGGGRMQRLWIYHRALRTSEAVANSRAGCEG